ncbi:MAG: hypothetical protein ACQXXF_08655, partial [Thermoplasmatota archaeon]
EISTKYNKENKFIRILREIKPMILIGSDSHSVEDLVKTHHFNKKYSLLFKKEIKKALKKYLV